VSKDAGEPSDPAHGEAGSADPGAPREDAADEDPLTGDLEDDDDRVAPDAAPDAAHQYAQDDARLRRLLIAGALALALVAVAVSAVLLWPNGPSAQAAPSAASADAGFARDMAVHHQQAVELSFIVRDRTVGEDVRTLAYDIINTQANQRGMLLGWLDGWDLPKSSQQPFMSWMNHDMKDMKGMKNMPGMKGMHGAHGTHGMAGMNYQPHDGSLMPGMATNHQLDELRSAKGKNAEILYLQLMTAHHEGGVAMADAAADLAKTEVVRHLAQGMAASQKSEIQLMADMLRERGAKA
jgi:uncharacterized protein (DUF305 family)